MSIEVVEQSTKSNFNFNTAFAWYHNTLEGLLNNVVQDFLQADFHFKLISVSKKPNIITKNDSYFVTQVKLHDDFASSLKLSQNTIDMFLEVALGESEDGFEIEYLTELEAKVLTAFNHNLYKEFSKIFIPSKKIKTLINENEFKNEYIYFTFLTQDKNHQNGKIIAILPSQLLIEPSLTAPTPESLPEIYFNKSPIEVDIFVGQTKILLEDMKMLQKEDIVILEKSDISSMNLVGDFEFKFNVNPDPMLVYNYQDNSEYEISEDKMTDTKNKNRWDLIQVEMSAEFEKIKMPLGELRQISKGLIVDLADVYQNAITLKVENNAIAKGELVIIDDKYGVLIKEIFTEEPKETSETQSSQENQPISPASSSENGDDDFDLEDFDIDDEDLDEDFDDDFDDEDI